MKRHSVFSRALAGLFIAGCAFRKKNVSDGTMSEGDMTGRFYCGDGMGCNLMLTLHEGGTFESEWHGCLGKYGDARGTWALTNSTLVLTSANESGSMKGYLRTLELLKYRGKPIFVRSEDRDFYRKMGVDRASCFQKVTDL